MPGPLDGVRVLELPAIGPVPLAAVLLADLGAEVIRIDRRPGGASLGELLATSPMGRGRKSVALDLRKPEGADAARRLADTCDAVIEGFRPGVAERLGLGPDELLARNPKLVYGRMTGWGQQGPLSQTAGHDITYLAVTGLLHGIGLADGPPIPPVNYVADFGGGTMFLVTGVLAALLSARATGAGQVVDAAMVDGASFLGSMTRSFTAQGFWKDEREANLIDGGTPNYRCYATSDGKWLAVGAIEPQFWAALMGGLGLDPATCPSPYDQSQWTACAAMLTDQFAARTRDEWAAIFEPLDACVAPVLTLAESLEYPHNVERNAFVDVAGSPMPGPAPRFSRTQGDSAAAVSLIGADTAEVLSAAGLSSEDLNNLRTAGVID